MRPRNQETYFKARMARLGRRSRNLPSRAKKRLESALKRFLGALGLLGFVFPLALLAVFAELDELIGYRPIVHQGVQRVAGYGQFAG